MARKITGGGILNAMNQPSFEAEQPSVTTFVEQPDGTLINPTEKVAEIGIMNAKTPDELNTVLDAVQTFDETKNNAYNAIKKERKIVDTTTGALANLTSKLTPAGDRTPDFSVDDIDMGMYNTLLQYPPEERKRIIEEARSANQKERRNASEPAIEAMGVQQYFPSLGSDNIRVGGYSGKVIGNIDIFVPRGGQLPFGLRDARRRAIQQQAQEKAVQAEKIKQLHYDTADQYQSQFDDMYMKTMDSYLKSVDYDVNELANGKNQLSREYHKTNQKFENIAKEISYVDTINKQILDDLQKGREVPQGVIEDMMAWKEGQLNLEEFIKDGGKFPELSQKLKSYSNIIKITDEMADQMKETGMTIKPINPDNMNADTILKANDAFKLKKGSGYDSYISGIQKYFDTEMVENQIDTAWEKYSDLYRGNGSKEDEQRQKAVFAENFISKLGKEVTLKQDTVANDDLERKRLALDLAKFNKETEQFYNEVDKVTNNVAQSADSKISLREKQLGRKLNSGEKTFIINNEYSINGLTPETDRNGNPTRGFATFKIPKTTGQDKDKAYIVSAKSNTALITVKDGNKTKNVTIDDFAKNGSKYVNPTTGKAFTRSDIDEANEISRNENLVINGENQYGYYAKYNPNSGVYVPSEFTDWDGKNSTMVSTEGSVILGYTTNSDGKQVPRKSTLKVKTVVDNSSQVGQAVLGVGQEGKTAEVKKIPN